MGTDSAAWRYVDPTLDLVLYYNDGLPNRVSDPLLFGRERAIAVGSWQYFASFKLGQLQIGRENHSATQTVVIMLGVRGEIEVDDRKYLRDGDEVVEVVIDRFEELSRVDHIIVVVVIAIQHSL